MKHVALLPAVIALLFAGAVSAQTYYSGYSYPTNYSYSNYSYPSSYSYSYPSTYGSGCVILASDLSYGSRSTEVTKLQQFLVSQNYPGSGSWMVTGYYGTATTQAVKNFQQSAGLSMTGYVDWATRSAIQMRTCGGGYPSPTYPGYPSTPTYPSYPSCGYYRDCEDLEIDRLRPTSGEVGDTVRIEGSGFSPYGNVVYFDNYPIATVSSYDDGEEIRFEIPRYLSYGNQYGYGGQYGYGTQYNYGYQNYGYPYNYGYGTERVEEGRYDVTVRNAFGQVSNSRTFRVTDDDNDDELTIKITDSPSRLDEDEEGEWEVEIEAPDNRTYTVEVDWDDGDKDIEIITGDETLTFEHEYDDEGEYRVEFRVSGHGESDTDVETVEVED